MAETCRSCYYSVGDNACLSCYRDGNGNFSNYRPKQSEVEHEYDLACDEISGLKKQIATLTAEHRATVERMNAQIEKLTVDNGQLRKLYADTAQKVIEFYERQAKWETF